METMGQLVSNIPAELWNHKFCTLFVLPCQGISTHATAEFLAWRRSVRQVITMSETEQGSGAQHVRGAPLIEQFPAWHPLRLAASVDHQSVIAKIAEESGWSGRFAFMTVMSAGIAVLGLLLSSPAVVIGAMLISPLMGPIMGLGFSLALFDFSAMRRSVAALLVAAALAVGFTALVVLCSPLKVVTTEILARTRPNLFDLLVALFSALAGAFAIIRGRGETIVGVAIATALMPPLATVGFGLATGSAAVAGGAAALFATNFVTIALATTIMARLYGFGSRLSSRQSWLQTAILLAVFVIMAVPLAAALSRIAREAVVATQVRTALTDALGKSARVTQLDFDYDAKPLAIRAVVILPKTKALRTAVLTRRIESRLGQPISLQADQVLVDPAAAPLDQERSALSQAQERQSNAAEEAKVRALVALAADIDPGAVTLDRENHRALGAIHTLPGATLATYRRLEGRIAANLPGWTTFIVPPAGMELPVVAFDEGSDQLSDEARAATLTAAWAVKRWNDEGIAVPGLTEPMPAKPSIRQRRAAAIAKLLRDNGIAVSAADYESAGPMRLKPIAAASSGS